MPKYACLESFTKEIQFLGSIASSTGVVDAALLKEQLIGAGAPAAIFSYARDSGAIEDDMRSFLLSLREMKAGGQPLLMLDALKCLQCELWLVNTGIARQHGPGVNATVQAQLGAGTVSPPVLQQGHERSMCSDRLHGHQKSADLPEEELLPPGVPNAEPLAVTRRQIDTHAELMTPTPDPLSMIQRSAATVPHQQNPGHPDSFQVPQTPSRVLHPLEVAVNSAAAAPASNSLQGADTRYPTSPATKAEEYEYQQDGNFHRVAVSEQSPPNSPDTDSTSLGQDDNGDNTAAAATEAAESPCATSKATGVSAPQQDSNGAASSQSLRSEADQNRIERSVAAAEGADTYTPKGNSLHQDSQPPVATQLSPATPYIHPPATTLLPFPPMYATMHVVHAQQPPAVPTG